MGIHGRSNPGSGSSPPRYPGTFLLAFREALDQVKWTARRWLGDAVECLDAAGEVRTVGLENLFRRVRRESRENWPGYIADFLSKIGDSEKALQMETDLASAADRLLARLGQPFADLPNSQKVWSTPLAGTELILNLVIDHAETMTYVTERLVQESSRPGEEWLERALVNLRGRTLPEVFQVIHEDSGMLLCNVGDAYDASRALIVDELLPEYRATGYFVAVPSRDELMVLPVTPRGLAHLHLLKLLAEKSYKSVPYPISAEVFWVRDRSWLVFPISIQKDEVTIRPPPEFSPLLASLGQEERLGDIEQPPEGEGDEERPSKEGQ